MSFTDFPPPQPQLPLLLNETETGLEGREHQGGGSYLLLFQEGSMVLLCFIFHIYDAEHYLGLNLATSHQGQVQTLPL